MSGKENNGSCHPVGPGPDGALSDRFLVCGLGRLGQHCVAALRKFGVRVGAIDLSPNKFWEFDGLLGLLDGLEIGDCRDPGILKRAGVDRCRAVLAVTENERVNIETALAARSINPRVRLVIKSSKSRLNEILRGQLGDFVAFDPTELSGPAFALAALGDETVGRFDLEGRAVEVVRRRVETSDAECGRTLESLNESRRRILAHGPLGEEPPTGFHRWDPETVVRRGDLLVSVEAPGLAGRPLNHVSRGPEARIADADLRPRRLGRRSRPWRIKIRREWFHIRRALFGRRVARVAAVCGLVSLGLIVFGTLALRGSGLGLDWVDSLYAAVVLLLGGFADIMNSDLRFSLPAPWWMRLLGLGLTVAGTVLVGVIFALITGNILAASFQFHRRPQPPKKGHVVLIGLGRVGHRVAEMLDEHHRPWAGIVKDTPERTVEPHRSIFGGDAYFNLVQANVRAADGVVAVTNDEMLNMELCLVVHRLNPRARLVIRTYHKRFNDHVAQLFPYARVLCVSESAAEAFAAAAFGEEIPNLFHLGGRVVMVTRYRVEPGDTLCGRLLADAVYGFGLAPLLIKEPEGGEIRWMPEDDLRLRPGHELTVLAYAEGLRRVERGELAPREYLAVVERAATVENRRRGAEIAIRITGCDSVTADLAMEAGPVGMPLPVYRPQGRRLVEALRLAGLDAGLRRDESGVNHGHGAV